MALTLFWRVHNNRIPTKFELKDLWHFLSPTIGSSAKKHTKKHGDKWYKNIEHEIVANDCSSDLDEQELTDDEDLNNNNQSLLSNYKSNEPNASVAHSSCVRDFFDCLRFRRNYKRNRKKCDKGQSRLSKSLFLSFFPSFFCSNILDFFTFCVPVEIAKLFKQLVRQISRKDFSCGHSVEKTLRKMYSFG